MDIAAKGTGYCRHERVVRQVLELGHPQVSDGDEVLGRPEATGGGLGLLQEPIHGLDEGIAAAIEHAPHHAVEALMPLLGAGLINADPAHTPHVVLSTRQRDVVSDPRPKLLGGHTHQAHRLADRQLPAQRQGQGLEKQGETAAFPRQGHRHLGRLAAATALDAGYFGMQPGFILKEVEVTPTPGHAVMDALVGRPADWADHALRLVGHLEVDQAFRRVQLDVFDRPRRLQAEGRGEQGFDGEVQGAIRLVTMARIRTDPSPLLKSNPTGNGIEPKLFKEIP